MQALSDFTEVHFQVNVIAGLRRDHGSSKNAWSGMANSTFCSGIIGEVRFRPVRDVAVRDKQMSVLWVSHEDTLGTISNPYEIVGSTAKCTGESFPKDYRNVDSLGSLFLKVNSLPLKLAPHPDDQKIPFRSYAALKVFGAVVKLPQIRAPSKLRFKKLSIKVPFQVSARHYSCTAARWSIAACVISLFKLHAHSTYTSLPSS